MIAHYRQLFEAAGVRFTSNFDGSGTSIRGAAAECDLLIKIREEGEGTSARVSCATKSAAPLSVADVVVTNGSGGRSNPQTPSHQLFDAEKYKAEHRQRMADESAALQRHIANNKAGRFDEQVYPHAPENDPPPLAWPSWLVHIRGGPLNPEQGVDQSRVKYLMSKYVSGAPKNADGYLEGAHHPYDVSGPRTIIRVTFSRFHLNDPIDVRIKFTAHARY